MTTFPEIKKFTLLGEHSEVITSSDTSNTIPFSESPRVNYLHVVETWECLDCKYEGDDTTFIWRDRVISVTENTHSSEVTLHCPKCDGQSIKRPEPLKIEFYGYEGKTD